MTLSIYASPDHAQPYPIVPSAPCCGRPVTDYEPIPPADMLMGIVTQNRQAMDPALRGMAATRPWMQHRRPTARLGGCGCDAGRRRTAMSGAVSTSEQIGAFDTSLLDQAIALAREAVPSLSLPPSPLDVIDSIWRLAEIEREIVAMRTKLQRMRIEGVLVAADLDDFNTLRKNFVAAAKPVFDATVSVIRTVEPLAVALVPPLRLPPGIDGPPEALPFVPDRNDLTRIRNGDISGFSSAFQSLVDEARRRLHGGGTSGHRGLGDPIVAGTISATLLAVLVAIVVVTLVIGLVLGADAIANVMIVWAQSFAHARTVASRERIYADCADRGGSPASCTSAAQAVAPTPDIEPVNSLVGGGMIVGLALAGAAWWLFGTESGAKQRKAWGMGNVKFRSKKFRRFR